jgi:hypothetical protein
MLHLAIPNYSNRDLGLARVTRVSVTQVCDTDRVEL